MNLPCLPLANLGAPPAWQLYPRTWPGDSWTPVVAIVLGVLLVPLGCALIGFLRLRTLSGRAKGSILGGCAVAAAVSALVFGPDVGLYMALGFTLQVTAALNWSERCYALLGGRTWQRVATAASGVVVALGIFGAAVILQQVFVYVDRSHFGMAPLGALFRDGIHSLSPFLALFCLALIFAAVQHMRAYYRARDWELARETGEPPTQPVPEPDATNAPPNEPS